MRSEFDFIQNLRRKYGLHHVGDDCAVLPKDDETDLVITADLLVEDIDFRLEWTTPEFLGHKALAVSLSDIAAMGARPRWAMISIGVPSRVWNSDFLDRFYAGWQEIAAEMGVELVGGDISRVPDKMVFDSVAAGTVPRGRAILRSTANEGDAIFVSGSLGGAAGGLSLLNHGQRFGLGLQPKTSELLLRQLRPQPRTRLGTGLREGRLASAMIDISDGFSSDLEHLCRKSGVGASIESIPVDPNLGAHFAPGESVNMALHGGEDFELLFTVPPAKISQAQLHPILRVGTVTRHAGIIEVVRGGNRSLLHPKGYRHF